MERAALKTLMSSYVTASELFDVEVIYFSGDVQPGFRGLTHSLQKSYP